MAFVNGHTPWHKGKKTGLIPRTAFKKGHKTWNKGLKGLQPWMNISGLIKIKKGGNSFMKGKHHSKEHKKKMSLLWNTPKYKKIAKERRAKQILPVKDTKIEVKIQNFLKQLGIEYFTHQYMKIEHGYQCDILIPSINLVIECDGDYWHKYPVGRMIDNIRTFELLEKGFKVIRLWENEIKIMDLNKFKQVLKFRTK